MTLLSTDFTLLAYIAILKLDYFDSSDLQWARTVTKKEKIIYALKFFRYLFTFRVFSRVPWMEKENLKDYSCYTSGTSSHNDGLVLYNFHETLQVLWPHPILQRFSDSSVQLHLHQCFLRRCLTSIHSSTGVQYHCTHIIYCQFQSQ